MPIYEYRCQECQAKSSIFVRSVTSAAAPTCQRCGSARLVRLMSSFSMVRGAGPSGDAADEDAFSGMDEVDEGDPRSVARWMKRMKDEMGEEAGPEFDHMVDKLEAGEMPEEPAEDDSGLDDDEAGDFEDD